MHIDLAKYFVEITETHNGGSNSRMTIYLLFIFIVVLITNRYSGMRTAGNNLEDIFINEPYQIYQKSIRNMVLKVYL